MIVVRWILRCYPKAWRKRYEEEMLDFARVEGASIRIAVDLLAGALDARLHPQLVSAAVRPGLVSYDEGTLLSSSYRPPPHVTLPGILSWIGWTLFGGASINSLIGLVWYSGWGLGLLSEPDPDSVAGGTLQWVAFLTAPFIGNLVVRRLVRAGSSIGWTLVGWWFISLLTGLLWISAWAFGLVARPADADPAAAGSLLWVQFLTAPVIGIVIRRLVGPYRRRLRREESRSAVNP